MKYLIYPGTSIQQMYAGHKNLPASVLNKKDRNEETTKLI
jgi:hypothetical protein